LKNLQLPILIICLSACTTEDLCDRYRYDISTGKCKNCNGETGLNQFDRDYIRSTKDAECFDLSRQELILLHKKKIKSGSLAYDSLVGYNFKGAKLDSAQLFFNFIFNADLRGTDLSTLQYGYASVTGLVDQYTILPLEGSCKVSPDSLSCYR
jgi:hypothetical protein